MSTTPLLRLTDVTLKVENQTKVIVENINLEIYPNTITTIIGPNGGGKSTLLKLILGLTKPTSGSVTYCYKNLQIGYLPQKLAFDQSMPLDVKQLLHLSPKFHQENYEWLVKNLDLERILHTSIHTLSGGERQRAFLARCLMSSPQLLVLDEPAQGVDISRQSYLYQLINTIKKRYNCAVLLVSHDLMLVMANTDHVICLDKHICCEGQPVEISTHNEFKGIFGHVIAQNIQNLFGVYAHDRNHTHVNCNCGSHEPHPPTPSCNCKH